MKLDATALKLLTQRRRFNSQTLEIAKRRVLGEESATALAAEYGVNLRRIYAIEKQIIAAWRELHLPPGWSEITLAAPRSLIAEFKRRTQAAREQLLRENSRRIRASVPSKTKK